MKLFSNPYVRLLSRSICIALALALVMTSVYADDITLFLDNKPLPESYELIPGAVLDVGITISEGILIKEVEITTDNLAIKEFANQLIPKEFERPLEQKTKDMKVPLPAKLPSSTDDVTIAITYLDKEFNEHTITHDIRLSVTQGTWWMTALSKIAGSQTAIELANNLGHAQLTRLNPELRPEDVTKEDLDALGITPSQYFEALRMLRDAESLENRGQIEEANQFRAQAAKLLPQPSKRGTSTQTSSLTTTSSKNPHLGSMSGTFTPTVTATKNTYDVTYKGNTITKSKIVFSVPSEGTTLSQVSTVIVIPKDIASDVSQLEFSEEPEVLEADPVVKWAFQNIPQGQVKDYSFTVNADVQNFETLAAATAEKPSFMYRLIMWILTKVGVA